MNAYDLDKKAYGVFGTILSLSRSALEGSRKKDEILEDIYNLTRNFADEVHDFVWADKKEGAK